MHGAVIAGGAVGDSSRPLSRIGDKILQRLPRTVGAHRQHRRIRGQARNGNELVELKHRRTAGDAIGLGKDRDRRQREQQRVAIRLGLGHVPHADATAGTGLVLDDDGRVEHAAHRVGCRPGDDIGNPSRRERNNQRNRLRRVRLLRMSRRNGKHRQR